MYHHQSLLCSFFVGWLGIVANRQPVIDKLPVLVLLLRSTLQDNNEAKLLSFNKHPLNFQLVYYTKHRHFNNKTFLQISQKMVPNEKKGHFVKEEKKKNERKFIVNTVHVVKQDTI